MLYHSILTFKDPWKEVFLKTLWEKEKMLVTSIFSFSHNVFYPSKTNFNFSATFNLSSANAFNLDQSKNLSFGKELTLSQTSPGFYVSAVQVLWKHCGKRRSCSLWAICPFPTVLSTRLDNFLPLSSNLELSSANCFSLEGSKICHLGKG